VRLGKRMEEAGKPQAAATVYNGVLESSTAEPRERRCQLFEEVDAGKVAGTGDLPRKLRTLRSYCPKDTAHRDRAAELEQQGKTDQAVQQLRQQVRATPKHEESYLALQRLHVQQGQLDEAARTAKQVLGLEQDPAERCRLFKQLHPRTVDALDPKEAGPLRARCPAGP
jgi:tetratricopeptide (TPR) repeat protein